MSTSEFFNKARAIVKKTDAEQVESIAWRKLVRELVTLAEEYTFCKGAHDVEEFYAEDVT